MRAPSIGWLAPPQPAAVEAADRARRQIRAFLNVERQAGGFAPRCDAWLSGWDPAFTMRLAAAGFVGMAIPREYGGGGRSMLERFTVIVELLLAGAPVAAHWIADRQVAPSIVRFGTEAQKQDMLPRIARGELTFALGLSEPDSGSDLASLRTTAKRGDDGWRLTGRKIWTSGGHRAAVCTVLCRTSQEERPHAGLSQLLVPMDAPGVEVRPIRLLDGEEHFSEVVFDDVRLPNEAVLGVVGDGWRQITAELAVERSGPERFLSTIPLLLAAAPFMRDRGRVGELYADLHTLWMMSWSVAEQLERGESPVVQAAIVKDLGTAFESHLVDVVRDALGEANRPPAVQALMGQAILHSPGYTLRGGTSEILRSIVARELTGVRA